MRECGKCDLCCVLFHINDPKTEDFPGMHKPAHVRCEHLTETGCNIHQHKGPTCNKYRCLWLRGVLPEWMKPDEIGLILDRFWTIPNKVYIQAHAAKPIEELKPTIYRICRAGYLLALIETKDKIINTMLYESVCNCDPCQEQQQRIQERLKVTPIEKS